jgi:hypothetical protein
MPHKIHIARDFIQVITANWGDSLRDLFHPAMLPNANPELWPLDLLSMLVDLSDRTAVNRYGASRVEHITLFQHAREYLIDLCQGRKEKDADERSLHEGTESGIMKVTDVELVIEQLEVETMLENEDSAAEIIVGESRGVRKDGSRKMAMGASASRATRSPDG